ncbi:MAG TPA: alpha/beta hydrolase, partial [Stellaceae bacterium]|nr:alpha/beta hydrolase [Stellaceae bacterium]
VLCNTPTRIPDHIKRTYALDKASASDAMRAYGVGEWCRQTLGYRLDMEHASASLCDWVVREMDRTPREIAAAMHDCFEAVDTVPLLPRIKAPALLLSGDKSPIASAQQKTFADTLPNGRVEEIAGVGHGVNLLQPERCARAALEFWRSV